MAKREPVRIPLDFEQTLSDLMKVKPPAKPAKPPKAKKMAKPKKGR